MHQNSNTPRGLTTRELANFAGVTPEGIRVQLCRAGSYFGVTPDRLPNGRLIWPADSRERLLAAGRKTKPRTPPGPRSRREGEGVAHG
jgi:hypothetical protein